MAEPAPAAALRRVPGGGRRPLEPAAEADQGERLRAQPFLDGPEQRRGRDVGEFAPLESGERQVRPVRPRGRHDGNLAIADPLEDTPGVGDVEPVVERLLERLLAERVRLGGVEERFQPAGVARVDGGREGAELSRDVQEHPAVLESAGHEPGERPLEVLGRESDGLREAVGVDRDRQSEDDPRRLDRDDLHPRSEALGEAAGDGHRERIVRPRSEAASIHDEAALRHDGDRPVVRDRPGRVPRDEPCLEPRARIGPEGVLPDGPLPTEPPDLLRDVERHR